ncbi:T9SS C-terminal target domain-containing protein [Paludibacter sp. 221]|uniref:T9SS type A sorting domain-containing protein n=1 Tax=Paludibacter sp. 221 TaxID=2302939 RepID=UPI0013D8AC6B|nr:T9SS type A sorting domain-containing protein [Paludibacter sp. 221]NDV46884.1 T9SS C-terminal target domain-containing protein [Paludibacter sp. 221]
MRIVCLFILLCLPAYIFPAKTRVKQLYVSESDNDYRHTFLYTSEGKVQLETKYVQGVGNNWERFMQTEWFYEQGNCVRQTEREYRNDAWHNASEIEFEYDRVDNVIVENYFTYTQGQKKQTKKIRSSYKYGKISAKQEFVYTNAGEQLALENTFQYNQENKIKEHRITAYKDGKADLNYKLVFYYDLNGRLKGQLVKHELQGNRMPLDSISWYYFPDSDLVRTQRTVRWNGTTQRWENFQSIDYEYNSASELVAETYWKWAGMNWKSDCRYEYSYNNGVVDKRTLLFSVYGKWRDIMSINYSNFADGVPLMIMSEYDFWGGNAGESVSSYIPFLFNEKLITKKAKSIRVSHSDLVDTDDDIDNYTNDLVSVYPNPSDGIFYLNTEKYEILSWKLYNMKGQLVKSHSQKIRSGVVDITDMAGGIYLLHLETTQGCQRQKLIKH